MKNKIKSSIKATNTTGNETIKSVDVFTVVQKIKEAISAIEQYKTENPGANLEAHLSEKHKELQSSLRQISSREVDKFVAHAKEQGTKMSFDSMEMGILAAGRKDMQNGLTEILNTIKFDKPDCSKCDEEMDNRGRSKKKL